MKKYILIIISTLFMASCVSMRAPNNENRAKRKAARHTQGIENIVLKYPDMADSLSREVKGLLTFDAVEDSSMLSVGVDTVGFDSLAVEFANLYSQYQEALKYKEANGIEDMAPISTGTRRSPAELQDIVRGLQMRLNAIRNEMVKTVTDSIGNFTFEDKNIYFESTILSGKRVSNYKIKERQKEYIQKIITPTIDATQEESWFRKMISFLGWWFFIMIIGAALFGVAKLYLKFKPF